MTWDFAEANPFGDVNRRLRSIGGRVAGRSRRSVYRGGAEATIVQAEAHWQVVQPCGGMSRPIRPYYDNIGYADLSDFFYVWLRRSLGGRLPRSVPNTPHAEGSRACGRPYRFGGDKRKAEDALRGRASRSILRALRKRRRSVDPSDRLLRVQAGGVRRWQLDDGPSGRFHRLGDDARGLLQPGFTIDGTWPMRTERQAACSTIGHATRSRRRSSWFAGRASLTLASPTARLPCRSEGVSCPRPCGPCSTGTSPRWTSHRQPSGRGWPCSAAMRRSSSPTARR